MAGPTIDSVRSEYGRYKALAEGAIAQLADEDLGRAPEGNGSSVSTLVWHVSGNLTSRFTDFLTSDGEKPWREREEEFAPRQVSREELLEKWDEGWDRLFGALDHLAGSDLGRIVTIRGAELRVIEALHRSLAHTAYHVGQIVYLAKLLRGGSWEYLSIPPGGSEAYDRAPTMERPAEQAERVERVERTGGVPERPGKEESTPRDGED